MQKRSSITCAATLIAVLAYPLAACSGAHGGPSPDTDDAGTQTSDSGTSEPQDAGHDAAQADTAPPAAACGGFSSSTSTCDSCIKGTCCAAGSTCGANAQCSALATCIESCSTSSCATACQSKYPGGISDLSAFLSCTTQRCNGACDSATRGIGDACSRPTQCASGECTNGGNGGWCTTSCTQNTDCASSSSSVTNQYGKLDWCVPTRSGAHSCFPGCSSNSDCSHYPGTHCLSVTAVNGATTGVCSF